MKRFLAACTIAFASLAALPTVARAQEQAAVSVVTRDGASVFRLAFHIHRLASEAITSQNAAVAVAAGCNACEAVAISIQIVLVSSEPDLVAPENLALAMTLDCTSCEAFAAAYQLVLGTGDEVRLSSDGLRRLKDVRKALRDLAKEELSVGELAARVDALVAEIRDVLATELVAIRDDDDDEEEDDDDDGQHASPSPSPSATAETSPSASPSPSASASPEPSSSPSASPQEAAS